MTVKKIVLGLMPFWAPLSPPLGISLLKSYLMGQGYDVDIYDFNTDDELWGKNSEYFSILNEAVPANKRSNFYMVGFDVLSNHLTAYIHKTHESVYNELIRSLIRENYFIEVGAPIIDALNGVISEFYDVLGAALRNRFSNMNIDVFGISVYSSTLGPSLFTFKLIKEMYPGIKTIMGGGVFADYLAPESPNFPVFFEKTKPYIDTIIVGEGELLFHKYLKGELENGKGFYTPDDINRENLDLSMAVIPGFSGLNLPAYSQMAAYATRSCPFQCGFCSETVQWGKFRKKTGEQVVNELISLKNLYGGKLFMFGDSLLNQVITELSNSLLENKVDIYWDGYLRTDPGVCDPQNSHLWRRAGFYRARLGVETGSQRVLELMNKKITVDQIRKAISNLASEGVKTTTYWVIGYPGESEDDFLDTLALLAELKDDIYEADWHPFYFFPRGQVNSGKWVREYDYRLLYPEEFSDMLFCQTWVLNANPAREEVYDRLNRFGEALKKMKIPNPYSIMDIYQADKRWKALHPKAGPTILELHNHKNLR